MLLSVVVRTYNESRHLGQLLQGIASQQLLGHTVETVLVDSGSTDGTVEIAKSHGARVESIAQSEFTFGKSLNIGCAAAHGDILVFVSGHCIPASDTWLQALVQPIVDNLAVYTYGRQLGNAESKFSECQLLKKYFPDYSRIPQSDFFINNANSALLKATWNENQFDEQLTGLEDMELGKRLVQRGMKLAYCADAPVYHLHDESWAKVKTRYEREAIALQKIMPEVQISFMDFLRFLISSLLLDFGAAMQERKLHRVIREIVMFRLMQFWGSYRGNQMHRTLSRDMKYRYFYPK